MVLATTPRLTSINLASALIKKQGISP
ncbi:curli assembly protein CsgC, partial [Salmonella enterica subsp. enterica]|nr:curli assembly protein CsgC [Salmonella enterica subsp. enterica serovar Kisangani]EAB2408463.1 curli assembly protein CsgC [Salmonella enterica]EBH8122928.1 curli assembly protein CsgC [Salmonella enterica subsp. enterica serovar Typhimurium str. UK-1]EBH9497265.1 curli assembly protein CsgC [Salmonella enterica subsp. enterica serovar Bovismorbificans]EBQ9589501.1 curli assembly protein CsgC [Salmonella enterica subsp. enterica serovar Penarth]EBS3098037.1 curli assembly protein CsgC [Sal